MSFRTQFKPRKISGVVSGAGKTKQAAVAEADINLILKKYNLTKIPPPTSAPIYADRVILPKTLEEAMDVMHFAFEWFEQLPSEVRRSFDNDPVAALELVNSDLPAAVAKGLVPALKPQIIAKAASAATPEPPTETAKAAVEGEPKPEAKA